jgi:Tol biopolymer transport system component
MPRTTERTGIFPVLFFIGWLAGLATLAPMQRIDAQLVTRTWLPWRTVDTRHFEIHYPPDLEQWTLATASTLDAVDSAVSAIVGYTPRERTQVLVDNPYAVANGSAWPFIDRPVIYLWAAPPDPRQDIGEFDDWGQMLTSHEFAHIAHLTRPSRNAFARHLWQALPVNLGPIPLQAPRWVIEGYATYVEGRVTGSGRPHGAWRAAFLRQWALEGQLPRYEQLDAWGAYAGGEFAYLAGSAFLAWLTERPGAGDSSLVHLWRRMTARQRRGFDEAFVGVFGETPRALYGRFVAEITGDALAVRRATLAAGADTGVIEQRLSWETGDPAVSPDGDHMVIVLRSASAPSRVVVWRTAPEPDTARARRDSILLARDPEDVPARPIYPPPKHVIATLRSQGAAYESPRFMRDGRIVLWKSTPQGDGTLRPEIYLWNPKSGAVRRVTHGASVQDPDPAPDGASVVATRCLHGWCDLVTVSLADGRVSPIATGSPARSFYRPRINATTGDVLVSVHDGAAWRLAIVVPSTGALRFVPAPADDANRYDGAWVSPRSVVAVSDASGIPNLEFISLDSTARATPLTRVTGAAVAPEPDAKGRLWFLSLYSRGYDLRTVSAPPPLPVAGAPPSIATADSLRGFVLPVPPRPVSALPKNPVSSPRSFDLGARLFRWFPAPQADADGYGAVLALSSADVIARSEVLLKVAAGDRATWRGGALDLTWRGNRPSIRAELFDAAQSPSASRARIGTLSGLDTRLRGALLGVDGARTHETWAARYRASASASSMSGDIRGHRALVTADASLAGAHRTPAITNSASIALALAGGRSDDRRFGRAATTAGFTTSGFGLLPISASATYGLASWNAPAFEQFSIGGAPSALVDRSLLGQRLAMPALPFGIQRGRAVATYRVAYRARPVEWYYWGGSTSPSATRFQRWQRVVGVEWTTSVSAIAPAGTPAARAMIGIGQSLDAPFRKETRAYINLLMNP